MTTLKFITCSYLYYFLFIFILIKPFKYKKLFLCKFFNWEDLNTNKKLRGCNPNAEKLKGFIRMKRKEKYFFPCAWKDRLCVCVVCQTLLYDFCIDSFIRRGCSENCTGGFVLHWGVSLTRRRFSGQTNQVAVSAPLTLGTPRVCLGPAMSLCPSLHTAQRHSLGWWGLDTALSEAAAVILLLAGEQIAEWN